MVPMIGKDRVASASSTHILTTSTTDSGELASSAASRTDCSSRSKPIAAGMSSNRVPPTSTQIGLFASLSPNSIMASRASARVGPDKSMSGSSPVPRLMITSTSRTKPRAAVIRTG